MKKAVFKRGLFFAAALLFLTVTSGCSTVSAKNNYLRPVDFVRHLEKNGIDSFESLHADNFLTDPQILDIITYVIRELDEEGKISCRCAPCDSKDSEYDAEILEDGVRVTCKRCGATKLIPANSLISAHEFLNADSLELE